MCSQYEKHQRMPKSQSSFMIQTVLRSVGERAVLSQKCGVYQRTAFIRGRRLSEGGVYQRAAFIRGGVYKRVVFIRGSKVLSEDSKGSNAFNAPLKLSEVCYYNFQFSVFLILPTSSDLKKAGKIAMKRYIT